MQARSNPDHPAGAFLGENIKLMALRRRAGEDPVAVLTHRQDLAADTRALTSTSHERLKVEVRFAVLEGLTVDDFRPLLHDRFQFAPDGRPAFDVELAEVTEVRRAPEPGGRSSFSLVFAGGPNPPVPQGIYPVEHPGLGGLEIFVVPIGPQFYEAVFT